MKLKTWQYLILGLALVLMFGCGFFPLFGGLNRT